MIIMLKGKGIELSEPELYSSGLYRIVGCSGHGPGHFQKRLGSSPLFGDFFPLSEGLHSSQSASVILLALRSHHSHAY